MYMHVPVYTQNDTRTYVRVLGSGDGRCVPAVRVFGGEST